MLGTSPLGRIPPLRPSQGMLNERESVRVPDLHAAARTDACSANLEEADKTTASTVKEALRELP